MMSAPRDKQPVALFQKAQHENPYFIDLQYDVFDRL